MMMPSIFGNNFVDDVFDDFDSWFSDPVEKRFFGKKNPLYGKHAKNLMKTDVRETKDSYEIDVDLPGFKKDEKSGYHSRRGGKNRARQEPQLDSFGLFLVYAMIFCSCQPTVKVQNEVNSTN